MCPLVGPSMPFGKSMHGTHPASCPLLLYFWPTLPVRSAPHLRSPSPYLPPCLRWQKRHSCPVRWWGCGVGIRAVWVPPSLSLGKYSKESLVRPSWAPALPVLQANPNSPIKMSWYWREAMVVFWVFIIPQCHSWPKCYIRGHWTQTSCSSSPSSEDQERGPTRGWHRCGLLAITFDSPCRTWGRQCQQITVLFSSGPERACLFLKPAFQEDTTYQSCQGHKTYWLSLT